MGLDPRRDRFAVWAEKTGRVQRQEAPVGGRLRRGKYFEKGVAEMYGDITHQNVVWFDKTIQHPTRSWQVATPDAFILPNDGAVGRLGLFRSDDDIYEILRLAIGGVDAKTSGIGAWEEWPQAYSGKDVPPRAALQCHWTSSALDKPYWDLAVALSMDELRIYRTHRDAEIEAMLLEQVESFWTENVLGDVAPPPGPSPATTEALKRMFPRNLEKFRVASAEEWPLVEALRVAKIDAKSAELQLTEAENQIKYCIGESDGLLLTGKDKISWRKGADWEGPNWEVIARELGTRIEMLKPLVEQAVIEHGVLASPLDDPRPEWWNDTFADLEAKMRKVYREGARTLLVPREWTKE